MAEVLYYNHVDFAHCLMQTIKSERGTGLISRELLVPFEFLTSCQSLP